MPDTGQEHPAQPGPSHGRTFEDAVARFRLREGSNRYIIAKSVADCESHGADHRSSTCGCKVQVDGKAYPDFVLTVRSFFMGPEVMP